MAKGTKIVWTRKEKIIRRIKRITLLLVFLCAAGAAVKYLSFPWYIHKELPMICYQPNGSGKEEGVLEVRGWMLCYMFKADRFYGQVETTMGSATYKQKEYKGTIRATMDRESRPGYQLAKGYRAMHIQKADFEGDMAAFMKYWMGKDRLPIIEGRFKAILLESPNTGQYTVAPAKTVQQAWKVVDGIKENNPGY